MKHWKELLVEEANHGANVAAQAASNFKIRARLVAEAVKRKRWRDVHRVKLVEGRAYGVRLVWTKNGYKGFPRKGHIDGPVVMRWRKHGWEPITGNLPGACVITRTDVLV